MISETYSPYLFASSLDEWRQWLDLNCKVESAIFLIVFHKSSTTKSVHWHEAIEHALCYGWVDSIAHKRDQESCYLKFTPRNPKSTWGRRNIERAEKMIRLGFMRPTGFALIERAKATGKWTRSETHVGHKIGTEMD